MHVTNPTSSTHTTDRQAGKGRIGLFLLAFGLFYYLFHLGSATVELEMAVKNKGFMQLFWAYPATMFSADRVVWQGSVTRGSDPETFEFNGLWGQELCGDYKVRSYVTLKTGYADDVPQYCEGTFTFTCDCGGCTYTPGYWKNHPENWPVTSLTLGCSDEMTQAQLLGILNTPVRGDATIILAYHLIAAKLNVANGSDPSIGGAIAEADALLCEYPLRSKPGGDARSMILDVKNMLAGYNELGCGDEDMAGKDLPDETSSSWGELKANYR